MSRVVVAIVLLAHASIALAQASQPATSPTRPVDSLVAQLSADDWSAREAAQNKLVAMGPRATEALKRAAAQGAQGFVGKPFSPQQLIDSTKQLIPA